MFLLTFANYIGQKGLTDTSPAKMEKNKFSTIVQSVPENVCKVKGIPQF